MSTGVIISKPMEYCIPIIIGKILHVVAYIISAWALTLSVQQYRAMRRPLSVGQTTGSSHAFLCSYETLMSNRTVLMGDVSAHIKKQNVK